jgi:hypothetical protein
MATHDLWSTLPAIPCILTWDIRITWQSMESTPTKASAACVWVQPKFNHTHAAPPPAADLADPCPVFVVDVVQGLVGPVLSCTQARQATPVTAEAAALAPMRPWLLLLLLLSTEVHWQKQMLLHLLQ